MPRKTFAVLLVAAIISINSSVMVQAAPPVSGQQITIHGKDFYKDGKPWLPKGIKVEGFNEPGRLRAKNKGATQARDYWNADERTVIKRVFGADTIRFAVSQPGLDPQSPIYEPAYLDELLTAFKEARAAGFVVIPSMDAQGENGIEGLPCMPNDSTVRAWKKLAPPLANDPGVMFELFDEPCKTMQPPDRAEWAKDTQSIVDAIRATGAKNILLVDGLHYARSTSGLFPLIHDSLPNRMALAVHPYLSKGWYVNEQQWKREFGAEAAKYPTIASEWNAVSTGGGCVGPDMPSVALSLIRYLESLHIGLVGWAIDSNYGRLVKDHTSFEPTDYSSFTECTKTPTDSGGGKLLANYPND